MSEWISVEDRLPDDNYGRVLVWVVEQTCIGRSGYVWNCSHNNGVFSDDFIIYNVTHWQPIPDPPK